MVKDRLNFRVSVRLRRAIDDAAKKSGVKISEQARRTLEKCYEVEDEDTVWLPPILRKDKPGSARSDHGK